MVRHDPVTLEPDLTLFPLLADILRQADPEALPIPTVSGGFTDGRMFARLGIHNYGWLPLKLPDDFRSGATVHGADERVTVDGLAFGDRGARSRFCSAMAQSEPQAATDIQPALTSIPLPQPSTIAEPAVPTIALRSWMIRLSLLAVGLLAMRQALYIFYFQPWLGAASWLDPWLERSKCLITAWCGPDALPLHHGGVLFLLAALLCFGLALRTRPEEWPSSVLPAWPAWLSRPRATRVAVLLFSLMAAEAILYACRTSAGMAARRSRS